MQLAAKDYDAKLVLCFINEILLKRKYHLDSLDLRDFTTAFNCEKEIGPDQIRDFQSRRYYTLKLKYKGIKVVLRKHDFGKYSIEEYHEFFAQAWEFAKRKPIAINSSQDVEHHSKPPTDF